MPSSKTTETLPVSSCPCCCSPGVQRSTALYYIFLYWRRKSVSPKTSSSTYLFRRDVGSLACWVDLRLPLGHSDLRGGCDVRSRCPQFMKLHLGWRFTLDSHWPYTGCPLFLVWHDYKLSVESIFCLKWIRRNPTCESLHVGTVWLPLDFNNLDKKNLRILKSHPNRLGVYKVLTHMHKIQEILKIIFILNLDFTIQTRP
jgi:hypothetical protein